MTNEYESCACRNEESAPELSKKQHLMQQIAECEFICVDINLFLDTHPDDQRALADYNCYAEQLAALKDLYVKNYGPLANFGNSVSHGEWKWVRADWPWHSGHYMDMEEEK